MTTPLHVADRALVDASKATHLVGFLNPTNLAEEERAFFSSANYEPQFTYRAFARAQGMRDRLEAIRIAERTALGQLFRDTKDFLLKEIALLDSLGTEKFTDIQLYGTPSRALVSKAYAVLERIPRKPPAPKPYAATHLKAVFGKTLAQYGFAGWRVMLKPAVSRVAVSPSMRSIVIRENAKFSENDIKSLLVHEIGVHVLRAMNGYRQHYEIFGSDAIPGYLPTEEGLAALHELKVNALSNNRLRRFAGRVIAANEALNGSFRDVYNELCKHFTPKDAFALAVRVKRGLKDTSAAGGFIKDHVYLEGKLALEDYQAHGGKLTPLYAGKIGLEHIGLVEQEIIQPPEWLPKF
jgi:uncharacterized protein (TIGR02421 family)